MNERDLSDLKKQIEQRGKMFYARNEKLLAAVLAGDQQTADGIIRGMQRLKQEATDLRVKAVAAIEKTFSPRLTEDAIINRAFKSAISQGADHGS